MGIFNSSVSKSEKTSTGKLAPQKEAPQKIQKQEKAPEPGVFSQTGWAEKKDVEKRALAEYAKLKNMSVWQLESRKKEILKGIFPDADKKTYFQKLEVDKQIRDLESKLPYQS